MIISEDNTVLFELAAAPARRLGARFRLVWNREGTPTLELADQVRPFGLPTGDGVPLRRDVDVLLEASAFPNDPGVNEGRVAVRVGSASRRLRVFGRRRARDVGGEIRFESEGELTSFPLDAFHAYGGTCDGFQYPRNPIGKGFLCAASTVADVELPNVEYEDDRLSPERLVAARDTWWLQPRPAIVKALPPFLFPRAEMLGLARYHAPLDNRLPEVRRGEIDVVAGFPSHEGFQEAPPCSRVKELVPGTPARVEGCLPGAEVWESAIPRLPKTTLRVGRVVHVVRPIPQVVRLRPSKDEISITYAVECDLERVFVPDIHAEIPIALGIESVEVAYPSSMPIMTMVRLAQGQTWRGGEP